RRSGARSNDAARAGAPGAPRPARHHPSAVATGALCEGGTMTAETRYEVLGLQLGVGDHICGFYRKPAERDDILIPFLVEGLKAGDKCTCVVDSCTPGDVLASMSEHIEVEPYVSVSQLEVLDSDGTYLA